MHAFSPLAAVFSMLLLGADFAAACRDAGFLMLRWG